MFLMCQLLAVQHRLRSPRPVQAALQVAKKTRRKKNFRELSAQLSSLKVPTSSGMMCQVSKAPKRV